MNTDVSTTYYSTATGDNYTYPYVYPTTNTVYPSYWQKPDMDDKISELVASNKMLMLMLMAIIEDKPCENGGDCKKCMPCVVDSIKKKLVVEVMSKM